MAPRTDQQCRPHDQPQQSGHRQVARLQLVQPLADGPLATALASSGEGLHHVCFAVDDLDRSLRELDAPTLSDPYLGGKGTRVCFLADRVHGVFVELTEPAPTTLTAP